MTPEEFVRKLQKLRWPPNLFHDGLNPLVLEGRDSNYIYQVLVAARKRGIEWYSEYNYVAMLKWFLSQQLGLDVFSEWIKIPCLKDNIFRYRDVHDKIDSGGVTFYSPGTLAHVMLRKNFAHHLRVLLETFPELRGVRDKNGRSLLEVANVSSCSEDVINILTEGASKPSMSEGRPLDLCCDLSKLCKGISIFDPSANLLGTDQSRILQRYLRTEAQKLFLPDSDARVVAFPAEFPSIPTKTTAATEHDVEPRKSEEDTGWEAEKKAFEAILAAAKEIAITHEDLIILLFHSLKYGTTDDGSGSGKWESDIDMILIVYNKSTRQCKAIIFEVKALKRNQDDRKDLKDLKDRIRKALNQLSKHSKMLKDQLDWTREDVWVKMCLVLPNYDCAVSPGNTLKQIGTFFTPSSRNYDLNAKTHWMFKSHVDKGHSCQDELSEVLGIRSPAVPEQGNKEEFEKITIWCILHSCGLILKQRSDAIDEQHKGLVTDENMQRTTPVAILTENQMILLRNKKYEEGKPVGILGPAGTGKTFLILRKIEQLDERGLLSKDEKAMVIVESRNQGLYAELKKRLQNYGEKITVRRLKSLDDYDDSWRALVEYFKHDEELKHVKYVFVDQLEDFFKSYDAVEDGLNKLAGAVVKAQKLNLCWFLWNGSAQNLFSMEKSLKQVDMAKDVSQNDRGREIDGIIWHYLQARIRNTQAVSAMLDVFRDEAINTKAVGHHGLPVFTAICHDNRDAGKLVAETVHHLDLDRGVYRNTVLVLFDRQVKSPAELAAPFYDSLANMYGDKTPERGELISRIPLPLFAVDHDSSAYSEEEIEVAVKVFHALKNKVADSLRRETIACRDNNLETTPNAFIWLAEANNIIDFDVHSCSSHFNGDPAPEKVRSILLHILWKSTLARRVEMSKPDDIEKAFVENENELFQKAKNARSSSRPSSENPDPAVSLFGVNEMRKLLNKFRFVSFMDMNHVQGCESDVVIGFSSPIDCRHFQVWKQVSRAKLWSILVFLSDEHDGNPEQAKAEWPLPWLDWRQEMRKN